MKQQLISSSSSGSRGGEDNNNSTSGGGTSDGNNNNNSSQLLNNNSSNLNNNLSGLSSSQTSSSSTSHPPHQQQNIASLTSDELESKKRREVLARRPSYRKILNELSSADVSAIAASFQHQQVSSDGQHIIKSDPDSDNNNQHPHHHQQQPQHHQQQLQHHQQQSTITINSNNSNQPYLKVVPTAVGTIQLAPGQTVSDVGLHNLPTLTMTNATAANAGQTIVQYATGSGADGPFFLPGEFCTFFLLFLSFSSDD